LPRAVSAAATELLPFLLVNCEPCNLPFEILAKLNQEYMEMENNQRKGVFGLDVLPSSSVL
jgi:hypothetical protein